MADDCQTQSEAPDGAGTERFAAAKRFEHVRQKRRIDPGPTVRDADLEVRRSFASCHLHAASGGRELHGVGQQVPQHLSQSRRIAGDFGEHAVDRHVEGDRLCIGGRPDGFDRAANEIPEIDRCNVQPQIARRHRREIQQFFDDLHLRGGIAFDRVEDRGGAFRWHGAAAQHACPAEHGVEGRAELVREHRQEFVLDAIGLLEVANQLRALGGKHPLVIFELAARSDVHDRARRVAGAAVVVQNDAPAILQPPHLAVRAHNPVFDAVLAVSGDRGVDRAHDAIVIVGMKARECRVAQRTVRLNRIEAEDAVQALVVRGDAGLQIDVPRAHAGRPKRVPQSVPGEKNVLRRHDSPLLNAQPMPQRDTRRLNAPSSSAGSTRSDWGRSCFRRSMAVRCTSISRSRISVFFARSTNGSDEGRDLRGRAMETFFQLVGEMKAQIITSALAAGRKPLG
jgi:hypothetical protein